MHYIISSNPTTPNLSLPSPGCRARRQVYRIARGHYASMFSLMEARLRWPLTNLIMSVSARSQIQSSWCVAVLEEVLRLREKGALR